MVLLIRLRRLTEALEEHIRHNSADFAAVVAAQFTGLEGKYVKIADTVRSFKEIVEGKYDDIPEQAFYMVGTIEEALEKADKMKASA